MIKLIVGPKGSGKTKRLIALANEEALEEKGSVVFVDNNNDYMYSVSSKARFVNVTDYHIDSIRTLYGFICGMLSQNFDITTVYIDAFFKIIGKPNPDLKEFFEVLEQLSIENNVDLVLNLSCQKDELPEQLHRFII
ncbi:MAG: ATP-binding protein [Christensenellaceae bacterium]|nr:ATP-binding protein [Christensenellaceae bacterium]